MTRIFVIYAEEDHLCFDRLSEQARTARVSVEFDRMQVKQPWVPMWKTQCRTRIFACDGAIVFLSKRTQQGIGITWELECARESDAPMLGVHVDKHEKGPVPAELRGARLIEWNWPEIAKFIQSPTNSMSTSV